MHIAELFRQIHTDELSAAQIRIETLRDGGELAESLRQRVGFDTTTVTLSDARRTQGNRAQALRKAIKRL